MSNLAGRVARRFIPLCIGLVAGGAAVGALFGSWLAGLAAGAILAAGGMLMVFTAEANRPEMDVAGLPDRQTVHPEIRTRLKPIERLRAEVLSMIEANDSHPIVGAIALEARPQVDSMMRRALHLLESRRKLSKLMQRSHVTEASIEDLRRKLDNATDESVRNTTAAALKSREEEFKNYQKMQQSMDRLDANLLEAEAILAELRSQLAVAVADPDSQARDYTKPALTDLNSRLKTLSDSMEESVDVLRMGTHEL